MHFDKSAFCGVIAPIVNPCREDEGLDDKALIDNANRLLATKIKGLYINGGTGDAEKLTLEERKLTAGILVPARSCWPDELTNCCLPGRTGV